MIDPMTILQARVAVTRAKMQKQAFLSWLFNRKQQQPPQANQQGQEPGRLRQRWTNTGKGLLANLFKRFDQTYYSGNQS